jgi:hypothetical protein
MFSDNPANLYQRFFFRQFVFSIFASALHPVEQQFRTKASLKAHVHKDEIHSSEKNKVRRQSDYHRHADPNNGAHVVYLPYAENSARTD